VFVSKERPSLYSNLGLIPRLTNPIPMFYSLLIIKTLHPRCSLPRRLRRLARLPRARNRLMI
jgi:hypothetical protein